MASPPPLPSSIATNVDNKNDDDDEVHILQTLLTVQEVFVYRIPPMKSSGGHRAEDWDLANPLKTCKLKLERLDDSCLIKLLVETIKPGGVGIDTSLFAEAKITVNDDMRLEYYLQYVVDSSRYFVLKIENKASGQQASIGIGFRERDDASNFRLALQDYERSLEREKKAKELHEQYEASSSSLLADETNATDSDADATSEDQLVPQVSKLTLKEGEKIHINLKGQAPRETKKSSGGGGGAVPLLKKPPVLLKKPPAAVVAAPVDAATPVDATTEDADDEEWGDFESSA